MSHHNQEVHMSFNRMLALAGMLAMLGCANPAGLGVADQFTSEISVEDEDNQ